MENTQSSNVRSNGRELTPLERAWRAKLYKEAIRERNRIMAFVWSGQNDPALDDLDD